MVWRAAAEEHGPVTDLKLSAHFWLSEFIVSQTAKRLGIENYPPPGIVIDLRRLANRLESVRVLFNAPIFISSGYRCNELNTCIGGAKTSAHCAGLAADFTIPSYGTPLAVCQRIANSSIPFRQLIHEYGSWVHLAIGAVGMEDHRDLRTICSPTTGYTVGINPCGE